MRNDSDKRCRETQNTHFILQTFFFPRKSCRLLGNVEKHYRAGEVYSTHRTYGHKRILSKLVTLIVFLLQQLLHQLLNIAFNAHRLPCSFFSYMKHLRHFKYKNYVI